MAVTVKPLEWREFGRECVRAESPFGLYEVMWGLGVGGSAHLTHCGKMWRHDTLEAAKAAAQADYTARILSAVNLRPVAEVQAEAIAGAYAAAAKALPAITRASFDGVDEQIDGPYVSRTAILALAPADAAAALDRIRAEAREKALREAAKRFADGNRVMEPLAGHDVSARILALIKESAHD